MTDMPLKISSASAREINARGGTGGPRATVFYGWWLVTACAVALFWGVPVSVYSFSVFLKPLMQEFHVGRAAVSFAYTLHAIAAALCAPVVGWLIGRFGSRRVIVTSLVLFGLVFISFRAFSGGIAQLYFSYAALGIVGGGVGPIPYGSVVSRWFDRRRGLALGLAMLGIGCGAILVPPLAQHLITSFGWRTAYAVLGCSVLCVAVPVVALFLRDKPEDIGLVADGDPLERRAAPTESAAEGLSARDAWGNATFWLMLLAFFLVGASVQGFMVHVSAMLSDRGAELQMAAWGSSLLGAAVMISRAGTGYLLDRFFAPHVAAVSFGCVSAGIGLFLSSRTAPMAVAGAFLVGLGLGAEVDIIPYLVSRYFGLRSFPQIYSVAIGVFLLSGAIGPLLMGWGFDLTGSYGRTLMGFATATLLATLLMTRLGPYRPAQNRLAG
jgi:MFS family permease